MINQYATIDLDNASYQLVNLSGKHNFYIIGITDLTNIRSVVFSMAIDSGVNGKELHIQNIELPITGEISGVRFTSVPDKFYLKPVQVNLKNYDVIKEGEFDIEVNINPIDLG